MRGLYQTKRAVDEDVDVEVRIRRPGLSRDRDGYGDRGRETA